MNNSVKPSIIVVQPNAQEKSVSCCGQFADNLKVSSCFIIDAYFECIKGCDNSTTTYQTKTNSRDVMTGSLETHTNEHTTMSMKECSQCLCLCGAIPLLAQTLLLPFTIIWSAANAVNQSKGRD